LIVFTDQRMEETEVPSAVPGLRIFIGEPTGPPRRQQRGQSLQLQNSTRPSGERAGEVPLQSLVTPFGLPIECFPKYKKIIDEDAALIPAVNIMMKGAVAASTAKQYRPIILDFKQFCEQEEAPFPGFSEHTVLKFIAAKYTGGKKLGFFNTVLAALGLLEVITGREGTALSRSVRDATEAIQRHFSATKPAVRKATGLPFEIINDLLIKEVAPFLHEPWYVNAYHFRSLFRAVVVYFTFCRFDDFAKLTDKEFEDCGNSVKITFLTRKNDQMGDNSVHFVPERPELTVCPVNLIRCYFRCFNLRFCGTGLPVCFRLRKERGALIRHTGVLSRGNATAYFRKLLTKHGYQADKFTEKCLKAGGVTGLVNSGEPLENVQVLGGWKSLQTPLYYRNTSAQFKLGIAGRIPVHGGSAAVDLSVFERTPRRRCPEAAAAAGAAHQL